MESPNYLILRDDGVLCGYWRKDILLCDLAQNRDVVQIFEVITGELTLKYRPIDRMELKNEDQNYPMP